MRAHSFGPLLAAFALGAVVTASDVCFSGDAPPSMEEMMKKMTEAAALGPHHAEMGKQVGTWDVEFQEMGGAPSKGRAEVTWLMEGRWLQERLTTTMMGKPFESVSFQ